jgi:hypothetical protein
MSVRARTRGNTKRLRTAKIGSFRCRATRSGTRETGVPVSYFDRLRDTPQVVGTVLGPSEPLIDRLEVNL